jgi:hypothetical protein
VLKTKQSGREEYSLRKSNTLHRVITPTTEHPTHHAVAQEVVRKKDPNINVDT